MSLTPINLTETKEWKRALAIAKHGAAKMDAQGYTYRPTSIKGCYDVITPAGTEYFVVADMELAEAGFNICKCEFSKKNPICKHPVWLLRRLEEDAAADEAAEAAAIIREEELDAIERYYR